MEEIKNLEDKIFSLKKLSAKKGKFEEIQKEINQKKHDEMRRLYRLRHYGNERNQNQDNHNQFDFLDFLSEEENKLFLLGTIKINILTTMKRYREKVEVEVEETIEKMTAENSHKKMKRIISLKKEYFKEKKTHLKGSGYYILP